MASRFGLKGYFPLIIVSSLLIYVLILDSKGQYKSNIPQEITSYSTKQSVEVHSATPVFIIWTRWRSGSSYFGSIFSHAIPGTFYGYEPLHGFGIRVLRDEDTKTKYALKFLYDISRCRHDRHPDLFKYFLASSYYFEQNPAFKDICHSPKCYTLDTIEKACNQAPLRVFKIIRLSLFVGKYLLKANPNMKIIYLIRDPRPTLKSRGQFFWCLTSDCHDPSTVCDILEEEVAHAIELKRKFPNRFFYIRFEDFALNPNEEFKNLWESLGLTYSPSVESTVLRHSYNQSKTKLQKSRFGVIKDSKKVVFSWRNALDYKSMKKTQDGCESLLKKIGYRIFTSESEFDDADISPLASKRPPFLEQLSNNSSLSISNKSLINK